MAKEQKLFKQTLNSDLLIQFEAVTRRDVLESICSHTESLAVIKILAKEIKIRMSKENWTKQEISTGIESFIGSFSDELNKEDKDV